MPNPQTRIWKEELSFPKGCDAKEGLLRVALLLEKLDLCLRDVPGLDSVGAADLRLVCDEVGSNVVRHSTPRRATELSVAVEVEASLIRMRITDNGDEFDPFSRSAPYLGGDLRKRRVGGLGLYLIGQLFPLGRYARRDERNITEVEYHFGEEGARKMRRSEGFRGDAPVTPPALPPTGPALSGSRSGM